VPIGGAIFRRQPGTYVSPCQRSMTLAFSSVTLRSPEPGGTLWLRTAAAGLTVEEVARL
jgi:hypothetical protein